MREIISYDTNFLNGVTHTSKKYKPENGAKGMVTVSLFDEHGNKEREIKTENIITNLMSEVAFQQAVYDTIKYGNMPTVSFYNKYFNTLVLAESKQLESATIKKVDGNIIGYANRTESYSGDNSFKGSYNSSESKTYVDENGNTIIHLVYDFPTHSANGNINSMFWSSTNPSESSDGKIIGSPTTPCTVAIRNESVSSTTTCYEHADSEWKEIFPFRYSYGGSKLSSYLSTLYLDSNKIHSVKLVTNTYSSSKYTSTFYDLQIFTGKCNRKGVLKDTDGSEFNKYISRAKVVGDEIIALGNSTSNDIYIFDLESLQLKATNTIQKVDAIDVNWKHNGTAHEILQDGTILSYTNFYNPSDANKKYIFKFETRNKEGVILNTYDYPINDGNYKSSYTGFGILGETIWVEVYNEEKTNISHVNKYDIKTGEFVGKYPDTSVSNNYSSYDYNGYITFDYYNFSLIYKKNSSHYWGIGTPELPVVSYVKLPNEVVKTNTNTMKVQYDIVMPYNLPLAYMFD